MHKARPVQLNPALSKASATALQRSDSSHSAAKLVTLDDARLMAANILAAAAARVRWARVREAQSA